MKIFRCKYSDGMGSGCIYYSLKPEHQVLDEYELDKNLLELNKRKFDNIKDLLEATVSIQDYANDLKSIGIEL